MFIGRDADTPLLPRTIIRFGELYLAETKDEPNRWYMAVDAGGVLRTWGQYGELEDAIDGL